MLAIVCMSINFYLWCINIIRALELIDCAIILFVLKSVTNYYAFIITIIISWTIFISFYSLRVGVCQLYSTFIRLFVKLVWGRQLLCVATIFYCYFSVMVRYLYRTSSSKTINDNTLDDIIHSCAIENRPLKTFFLSPFCNLSIKKDSTWVPLVTQTDRSLARAHTHKIYIKTRDI